MATIPETSVQVEPGAGLHPDGGGNVAMPNNLSIAIVLILIDHHCLEGERSSENVSMGNLVEFAIRSSASRSQTDQASSVSVVCARDSTPRFSMLIYSIPGKRTINIRLTMPTTPARTMAAHHA